MNTLVHLKYGSSISPSLLHFIYPPSHFSNPSITIGLVSLLVVLLLLPNMSSDEMSFKRNYNKISKKETNMLKKMPSKCGKIQIAYSFQLYIIFHFQDDNTDDSDEDGSSSFKRPITEK